MTTLVRLIFHSLSRLPLAVLYAITDVLYFIVYRGFGVNRKLTEKNLGNSFPDKNAREIRQLGNQAARNLLNVGAEIIKGLSISEEQLRRRLSVKNAESVNRYFDQGQSVIIIAAHHCNWEWVLFAASINLKAPMDALFEPLHYPSIDRLFLNSRTRFGANMISAMGGIKELVKTGKPVRAIGIVGDQGPIRDHMGEVHFEPDGDGTRLVWRCHFNSRIPGLGGAIRWFIARMFRNALESLARRHFPDARA